jgi:hypothetical protein
LQPLVILYFTIYFLLFIHFSCVGWLSSPLLSFSTFHFFIMLASILFG